MRHRNGQLSANPFMRLTHSAMGWLSLHLDGLADDVKLAVGNMTPEQFKETWPSVFEKIGTTAVTAHTAALPKVPDKYELKLPEGSILPASVLEKVTPAARELGLLSNENAQRLVNLLDGEAKELAAKIAADYSPGGGVFEAQRKQYTDAALAAPDIGNGSPEVLQAKVALVTLFTNKYFPDDVRKLINDTGIGSHPNFFRSMFKLATQMKEDGFVSGSTPMPKKSLAERVYGGTAAAK